MVILISENKEPNERYISVKIMLNSHCHLIKVFNTFMPVFKLLVRWNNVQTRLTMCEWFFAFPLA